MRDGEMGMEGRRGQQEGTYLLLYLDRDLYLSELNSVNSDYAKHRLSRKLPLPSRGLSQ